MVLINKAAVLRSPELLTFCEKTVSADYGFFSSVYPQFTDWLMSRVLPGLIIGERTVAIEQRSGQVVGLLILKHTSTERKLCTLRVREEVQKHGLGVRLFETAFEVLETDKPLLSVADVNLGAFERIFRYFDFDVRGIYRDLYRPDSTEYSFNGDLQIVEDASLNRLGTLRRTHEQVTLHR